MWSKPSKHSLVAGAIEATVAAGCLILSSTFVIAISFPQSGYMPATAYEARANAGKVDLAKSSYGVERNTLALNRTEIDRNARTYNNR
jgi:hypothetical protein